MLFMFNLLLIILTAEMTVREVCARASLCSWVQRTGGTPSFYFRTRVMDAKALKCSPRGHPVALASEANSARISMGSLLRARNPCSDSVSYCTLAHTLFSPARQWTTGLCRLHGINSLR